MLSLFGRKTGVIFYDADEFVEISEILTLQFLNLWFIQLNLINCITVFKQSVSSSTNDLLARDVRYISRLSYDVSVRL